MFYKTIEKLAIDEFIEKRSRFIGHIKPVKTQEEAIAFIEEKRTEYWDATHNVYAYRLKENNICRYSDDGEPQGTAGIPVMEVLNKEELVNVVVVVTRYFGGTLLGAGGLVRAYSKGAKLAVDAGGVIVMRECNVLQLACEYSFLGKLQNELAVWDGHMISTEYTDNVTMRFYLLVENTAAFHHRIAEMSGGKLIAKTVESIFIKKI